MFWPKEWGEKYKCPMVPLILSLYGHPRAGNCWEGQMERAVGAVDFEKAPQWKSIYRNMTNGAGLGVYVDDFELAASPEDTPKIWKALEQHIEFKDPYKVWDDASPTRHLGCEYKVVSTTTKNSEVVTTIKSSMGDCFRDIVKRFEERMNVKVADAETPWLDPGAEKRYKDELTQPGKYGYMDMYRDSETARDIDKDQDRCRDVYRLGDGCKDRYRYRHSDRENYRRTDR